VDKCIANNIM